MTNDRVRISAESRNMFNMIKFMLSKNGSQPLLEHNLISEEEALNLTNTKIIETSLFLMMKFLLGRDKKQ